MVVCVDTQMVVHSFIMPTGFLVHLMHVPLEEPLLSRLQHAVLPHRLRWGDGVRPMVVVDVISVFRV